MCGIFAYLGRKYSLNEVLLAAMKLRHRGPDSSGIQYLSDELLFIFHRLAINGLHNTANMPLELFSRYYLICNGEIYNCKELEQQFGFSYTTENDCECIMHLYHHFDGDVEKVARSLDGVFAFVLYDRVAKRVAVANDPVGIRPLYYTVDENEWTFASEPMAFSFEHTKPQFFPPGHFWSSDERAFVPFFRYEWSVLDVKLPPSRDAVDDIAHTLFQKLRDAVHKRFVLSERPVAALLSGGIDSSAICTLLAAEFRARGEQLNCFTVGIYENDSSPDPPDVVFSKQVAAHIGAKHHVVRVTPERCLEAIPEVIAAIQSYDITTVRASVLNYLVAKYIKENTDFIVIFNGDVSEEQFGSYLYASYAPTPNAFLDDNVRLLREVHEFDVLRSARCIETHSLEARTPFADLRLLDFTMSWPPELKMFSRRSSPHTASVEISDFPRFEPERGFGIEKFILRRAMSLDLDERGKSWLPDSVVFRYKAAFSDAVSHNDEKSWHRLVQEFVAKEITDVELESARDTFPHNTPHTKESLYFRKIFHENLGANCAELVSHFWMPSFVDSGGDPSAREIAACKE